MDQSIVESVLLWKWDLEIKRELQAVQVDYLGRSHAVPENIRFNTSPINK